MHLWLKALELKHFKCSWATFLPACHIGRKGARNCLGKRMGWYRKTPCSSSIRPHVNISYSRHHMVRQNTCTSIKHLCSTSIKCYEDLLCTACPACREARLGACFKSHAVCFGWAGSFLIQPWHNWERLFGWKSAPLMGGGCAGIAVTRRLCRLGLVLLDLAVAFSSCGHAPDVDMVIQNAAVTSSRASLPHAEQVALGNQQLNMVLPVWLGHSFHSLGRHSGDTQGITCTARVLSFAI